MACSPPGSSAHGISQARIREWVAISYSMGSAQPKLNKRLLRLLHRLADSLPPEPRGKPINLLEFSTVSWSCQLGTWANPAGLTNNLGLWFHSQNGACSDVDLLQLFLFSLDFQIDLFFLFSLWLLAPVFCSHLKYYLKKKLKKKELL